MLNSLCNTTCTPFLQQHWLMTTASMPTSSDAAGHWISMPTGQLGRSFQSKDGEQHADRWQGKCIVGSAAGSTRRPKLWQLPTSEYANTILGSITHVHSLLSLSFLISFLLIGLAQKHWQWILLSSLKPDNPTPHPLQLSYSFVVKGLAGKLELITAIWEVTPNSTPPSMLAVAEPLCEGSACGHHMVSSLFWNKGGRRLFWLQRENPTSYAQKECGIMLKLSNKVEGCSIQPDQKSLCTNCLRIHNLRNPVIPKYVAF